MSPDFNQMGLEFLVDLSPVIQTAAIIFGGFIAWFYVARERVSQDDIELSGAIIKHVVEYNRYVGTCLDDIALHGEVQNEARVQQLTGKLEHLSMEASVRFRHHAGTLLSQGNTIAANAFENARCIIAKDPGRPAQNKRLQEAAAKIRLELGCWTFLCGECFGGLARGRSIKSSVNRALKREVELIILGLYPEFPRNKVTLKQRTVRISLSLLGIGPTRMASRLLSALSGKRN